jgi:uncharacterized protein (TIGR00369 family)
MIGGNEAITYLPSYDSCYVCGRNHPRGLRIRFYTDEKGQALAAFRPETTQTGYDDIVHGGVVSALLDELIGWSVSLRTGLLAYTAELTVRFVKPIHATVDYLASSRTLKGHGKLWEAEGEVTDDSGEVFARGRGKYFLLSRKETDEVAEKMTYLPGDLPVFLETKNSKSTDIPADPVRRLG